MCSLETLNSSQMNNNQPLVQIDLVIKRALTLWAWYEYESIKTTISLSERKRGQCFVQKQLWESMKCHESLNQKEIERIYERQRIALKDERRRDHENLI
jgi:hypothetical protein